MELQIADGKLKHSCIQRAKG